MFVNDFVSVPVPLDVALPRLGLLLDGGLGSLLTDSWHDDFEDWVDAGLPFGDLVLHEPLEVTLGTMRFHDMAVVVPMSWSQPAARLVPSGDADLEVAGRGGSRTDVRLLASMSFGPGVDLWSTQGGLAQRAASSALRRFLEEVAANIGVPSADLPQVRFSFRLKPN